MRGNLTFIPRDGDLPRSIPACAGEPDASYGLVYHMPVYPRVCGGTPSSRVDDVLGAGLSPRVRGNLDRDLTTAARTGSIPACAGEPSRVILTVSLVPVYPRVCGGTPWGDLEDEGVAGLSPRVRGNPRRFVIPMAGSRSIPACAGEPASSRIAVVHDEVYPRVCGGTRYKIGMPLRDEGLSPRVRGNRR